MKTLVHTDKELIEATIKKCDICYVGLADTDGDSLCIADELWLS